MKLLSPGETDLRTPDNNDNRVQLIFRSGHGLQEGINWMEIQMQGLCVFNCGYGCSPSVEISLESAPEFGRG
jgi:hypothetical protein